MGRNTQGVKIMDLNNNDKVVSLAKVNNEDDNKENDENNDKFDENSNLEEQ